MTDANAHTADELPEEANIVTKEFLEKVLQADTSRDDIVVQDFEVTRAVPKGDNYATIVLRVKVTSLDEGKEKQHNLIIKTVHNNQFVTEWVVKAKAVMKEVKAYSHLVPSYIQYQKDKSLEPLIPSIPKLYFSVLHGETGIIVLEDLKPGGYRMADKHKGLDFAHCKLAIEEFAKFHAISYAMKDGNPENLKSKFEYAFFEGLFSVEQLHYMFPNLNQIIEVVVDVIKTATNDQTVWKHAEKLLDIDVPVFMETIIRAEEPFAVICHGDTWCNNMIFKYNEDGNTPVGIKLLDLQILRYALPTTDLLYFFYSSTTRNIRQAHLNDLLKLYHTTFIKCLTHIKSDANGFTFEILKELFNKTLLFGILFGCMFLPLMLATPENIPKYEGHMSPDEIQKDIVDQSAENFRKIITSNTEIQSRLVGIMQDAIEFGVFE